MTNLDYNHQLFISQFIDRLREEGFYLNKGFDDTAKGGRFFKEGYKDKKKAFGKYHFYDSSSTQSGNPLIIYTFFGVYDKSGKEISKPQSNKFWWKPASEKSGKTTRINNQHDYKKAIAEREKKERELQISLRKLAFEEYKSLQDVDADPDQHKYLIKKNVPAGRGLIICNKNLKISSYYNQFKTLEKDKDYFYLRKGDLLIPAINLDLEFVTYQRITETGVKLQRIDISTVGAFYCIGDWRTSTKRIYLCEGYATGYSLYLATNGVVFVCFDVHNIGVVLKLIKERFPNVEVIICTDNDRKKKTKVGLFKGFEYSYLYNSPFIFPVFPNDEKYSDDSDVNDLSKIMEYELIGKMFENQIKFFYEKGKNFCIEIVAKKNGITGQMLKDYTKNNNLLFKTMDLSFK